MKLTFLIWGQALLAVVALNVYGQAAECPSIFGIHDHEPDPGGYLDRLSSSVGCGWVTATVAIGHNPTDTSSADFSSLANRGHTVICRINNGYYPNGTIPATANYDNFAARCANFVARSQGCSIWVIGNELNISGEWPIEGGRHAYVTPQSYAVCFRKVYNAIKAVRPNDRVIPQALAPWAGPYGAGSLNGVPHDAVPINWIQYLNQMLTAIAATGPLDGVALHINSRGYGSNDVHSLSRVTANGQAQLFFSFYVYKDWVERGIPRTLYHLPLYATECNGYYFWKGGHAENPAEHYEPGWVQTIYAEIDRYNQFAIASGRPIFRCVNLYRWCASCDGWNIDGSSNPYRSQILSDLDAAAARDYRWPTGTEIRSLLVSTGANWKYKDDGSNLGTTWRSGGFNDSSWNSGPAQLGYGDGDEATVVSFGPNAAAKFITTYFRRSFNVADPAFFTNLTLRVLRDDGVIVYLNNTEIFRQNLPPGTVAYNTAALSAVAGADESTYYSVAVPPALLVGGTNVIAAEVHQSSGDSSDLSFDLELRGAGNFRPTVRIVEPVDQTMGASGNLVVRVNAADADGVVEEVTLFANDVQVSRATAPPYNLLWPGATDGIYTLVAVTRDNGGLATTSAPVRLTLHTPLIRLTDSWRYLDDGSNQGTAWRHPGYNDNAWRIGVGQFGYGDGDEATTISYGPNSGNKFITTYFRHRFTLSDPGAFMNLIVRLKRDDGAVLYLNGTELHRSNMPAGSISFSTFASSAVGDEDEERFFVANVPANNLVSGDNLVAAEVHQSGGSSSDLSFELELLGQRSLTAPELFAAREGAFLRLWWQAGGFRAVSSDTAAADSPWVEREEPISYSNGTYRITIPITSGQHFFRLEL